MWVLAGCGATERPGALPSADVVVTLPDVVSRPLDVPAAPVDVQTFDAGVADLGVTDATAQGFDVDPNRLYPPGPFGSATGQPAPRFIFPSCSGATYDFGGPEFQRSRATVLALITGTCPTCAADARALQQIFAQYGGRGVRVVAVLLEGSAPMEQPNAMFCEQWRTAAAATHPVLLDVSRTLEFLTPTRQYPLVLVTDAGGIIRGRYAAQSGWEGSARALLDTLAP
jgi:hypothetical protein